MEEVNPELHQEFQHLDYQTDCLKDKIKVDMEVEQVKVFINFRNHHNF